MSAHFSTTESGTVKKFQGVLKNHEKSQSPISWPQINEWSSPRMKRKQGKLIKKASYLVCQRLIIYEYEPLIQATNNAEKLPFTIENL